MPGARRAVEVRRLCHARQRATCLYASSDDMLYSRRVLTDAAPQKCPAPRYYFAEPPATLCRQRLRFIRHDAAPAAICCRDAGRTMPYAAAAPRVVSSYSRYG